jgi:serine/threonine-protein kinase
MNLEPGQIVDGKYRIVRLLGKGAMGAVFEGENVRIRRRVAIKVLHAEVAERGELVRRFEQEAQAAGRIGSEHIVEVLDLGELPDGARYLVMEFLEGDSLRARIPKRTRVSPGAVVPLLRQLLAGLHAAHEAGIVHRDLKPDNVFVLKERAGKRDFVKILDFGISKFDPVDGDAGHQTRTGVVMGTPYYMSPEQARGVRALDRRSDLFSVGVILYEAVTGRLPFEGETFNELMFKIALQDAPAAESIVSDLDPGIAKILRRALARDPAARFATAAEFAVDLDSWSAAFESASVNATPEISKSGAPFPAPPMQRDADPLDAPARAASSERPQTAEGTNPEWSRTSARAEGTGRRPWAALALLAAAIVVVAAVHRVRSGAVSDPRGPASSAANDATGELAPASATTSTSPSGPSSAVATEAPAPSSAAPSASPPAPSASPRALSTVEPSRVRLPARPSLPPGEAPAVGPAPAPSGRRVRTF